MKKILSLLLVMAMLLSVAPMTWAAEQAGGTTAPLHYRSLVLNDSIAINFKLSRTWLVDNGFTKAEFVMDDKVVQTIEGMPAGDSELAVFPFTHLTPAQMGKDVTVKYYAGEELLTQATSSVLSYCNDTLNDADESALLKTALVDMLNYGAAAQTYVGLEDGETLVNADLGANAALGTPADKELTLTNRLSLHDFPNEQNSRSDDVKWLAAGLNLQDSVALRFKIEVVNLVAIKDVTNVSVKFYNKDFQTVVTELVPVAGQENQYYVYLNGLNPAQLRDPIWATVYDNTSVISNRLTYSAESYAADNASDSEALKAMTKAMMVYGDAVTAWVTDAETTNVGSDMTYIEAEDTKLATGHDGTFEHNSSAMVLTNDGKAVEWGIYGSMVNYTPNGNTVDTLTNDLISYPAHLSFNVKPATTGTYYVWGLVSQKDGANVYGYIDESGKLDGWTYYAFNVKSAEKTAFTWVKIATCNWTAGETYGIRFRGRNSDWTVFDKFMVTSANVEPHDHVASAEWSKDDTNHWKNCTTDGCAYVFDKAAHSYDADGKCVCGKQIYIANSDWTFIEAENVDLFTTADSTMGNGIPVVVADNTGAINGKVAKWAWDWNTSNNKQDYVTYEDTVATRPAHVSFSVKATASTNYYVWVRASQKTGSNVVYCVDTKTNMQPTWTYWNLPVTESETDFGWKRLGPFSWEEGGIYSVNFRARNGGSAVFDQFMVTTDSRADITPHVHKASADWTTDETYHWHACTTNGCTVVSDKGEHVYTDDTDASCNTCDYTREVHVHTYSEAWSTDETYHWHAATCGCTDVVADKAAHDFGTTGVCECGKIGFYVAGSVIYIEAEDANLFEGYDTTYSSSAYPVTVLDDADASGGKGVQLGDGTSGRGAASSNAAAHPAHISFNVQATETKTYRIWVKAKECTDYGTNIFWCNNIEGTTDMAWTYFGTDNGTKYAWYSTTISMEAGQTYTIGFRPRDQYVVIDQFCISYNSYTQPTA